MKKWIAAALVMVSLTTFAQERPERGERPERKERPEAPKFTPEQRNELRLKELTLKLDLNASQQKEFAKLLPEMDAKREAFKVEREANKGKKLTSDEIFAKRSKMLDDKIAMKERIKKILNDDQMKKWEKIGEHRKEMRGKKMQHNHGPHRK